MLTLIGSICVIGVLLYTLYNFIPFRKRTQELEQGIRMYLAELALIEQQQKELDKRKRAAEHMLSTLIEEGGNK